MAMIWVPASLLIAPLKKVTVVAVCRHDILIISTRRMWSTWRSVSNWVRNVKTMAQYSRIAKFLGYLWSFLMVWQCPCRSWSRKSVHSLRLSIPPVSRSLQQRPLNKWGVSTCIPMIWMRKQTRNWPIWHKVPTKIIKPSYVATSRLFEAYYDVSESVPSPLAQLLSFGICGMEAISTASFLEVHVSILYLTLASNNT